MRDLRVKLIQNPEIIELDDIINLRLLLKIDASLDLKASNEILFEVCILF